jgi:hypothetical protein
MASRECCVQSSAAVLPGWSLLVLLLRWLTCITMQHGLDACWFLKRRVTCCLVLRQLIPTEHCSLTLLML